MERKLFVLEVDNYGFTISSGNIMSYGRFKYVLYGDLKQTKGPDDEKEHLKCIF